MSGKTVNKSNDDYKEILNMQFKEVLAMIAYNLEEEGATKGDAGRLVFENKYYGFSLTVVKKEEW